MFSSGNKRKSSADNNHQHPHQLAEELQKLTAAGAEGLQRSVSGQHIDTSACEFLDGSEKRQFLERDAARSPADELRLGAKTTAKTKKANLAKQETLEETDEDNFANRPEQERNKCKSKDNKYSKQQPVSCCRMMVNLLKCKRALIPLVIISCLAAIYCIPYIDIDAQTTNRLPHIPFNFRDGPLRPSSVSQFKVEHLFRDQINGPESVVLDSQGNMYMAIDGGFILYAHLNKSSPMKRHYYSPLQHDQAAATTFSRSQSIDSQQQQQQQSAGADLLPDLIKIAELNGIKQLPYDHNHHQQNSQIQGRRRARDGSVESGSGGSWRRECQLDEKVYGPNLYTSNRPSSTTNQHHQQQQLGSNEIDTTNYNDGEQQQPKRNKGFVSNVLISRCSKPLGVRLSPDENYLYVIDTRAGLFRVNLNAPDRSYTTTGQRPVVKLVDFKQGRRQVLPVTYLDLPAGSGDAVAVNGRSSFANVSMLAVDDLVIDYGAGTRGGDIIYMSLASQKWLAVSYLYDLLEGRPSGAILRYDSGTNQLSVLDSQRVAHVRTSSIVELNNINSRPNQQPGASYNESAAANDETPYLGIGAPRLDENDVFDDRPLHFPNGMELTKDRQAILIADSSNKRIIKHYIRGARKGTSDLWAWTPNFPDNIRRGHDQHGETYWVVGCGQDPTGRVDMLDWLHGWPMLRKFLLKNLYLIGWFVEQFGAHVLRSTSVRDFGYSFKIGHFLCENMCPGMMIVQYNSYGDIIRSIYSKEFPNDLVYYSQVNEVVDAKSQEHYLYLSSPSYRYVTKLTLPTESFAV